MNKMKLAAFTLLILILAVPVMAQEADPSSEPAAPEEVQSAVSEEQPAEPSVDAVETADEEASAEEAKEAVAEPPVQHKPERPVCAFWIVLPKN